MQEIIRDLKRKYPQVYATIVGDDLYIWRPLGRREYREILEQATDEHDLEERIAQAAVVWPEGIDFQKGKAGAPEILAAEIKEASGYGSPERVYHAMDFYREQMQHFEFQAEAAIAAVFPQITFAEMENWTVDQLMWHAVRAEWAIRMVYGRQVEFRIRPEEEEATTGEQSKPDRIEEAKQMREQGIDPILTVDPKTLRPPFVSFPLIGGTTLWQNEELIALVREQIPGLSGVPGSAEERGG